MLLTNQKKSTEVNKITKEMVKDAPSFGDVADKVFELLDNRIWAGKSIIIFLIVGHNINLFDNKQIVKEFKKLNRKPPKPTGLIDTFPLLKGTFGIIFNSL